MDEPQRIIQLEQAWCWTCPDCQTENFAKSVQTDTLEGQDEETIRAALDLEQWEPIPEKIEGFFVWAPEVVTCGKCGVELPCFDPADLEDDDESEVGADDGELPSSDEVPDRMPEDI